MHVLIPYVDTIYVCKHQLYKQKFHIVVYFIYLMYKIYSRVHYIFFSLLKKQFRASMYKKNVGESSGECIVQFNGPGENWVTSL